jgi:hypothetical protein
VNAAANVAVGVAIIGTLSLAGCFIVPTDLGPGQVGTDACVARYQAGNSLTVRLGVADDARSEYRYEEGWLGPSFAGIASCAGTDGLQTGSVLTFALVGLADSYGSECLPWRATLQPEAIVSAEMAGGNLIPYIDGVTIATAVAEGTLAGRPLFAFRGLFSPSRDPDGALATAALPPLAVTRELSYQTPDRYDSCFDAWVATWEPAP